MEKARFAAVAAVASVLVLYLGLSAGPAAAHGALSRPVSRAAVCAGQGGPEQSEACRAAVATSADIATDWDNLRVPDVGGRDREVIPDGQLCSAGLDRFQGLNLARADWPATALAAGAEHAFTYRATIPHKGTFRMYLTRDGYDPTAPLRWSDLEPQPFLTATDPPLVNGSYAMSGRLPSGRTGRQLIYTIWQTSNTPDTYYSCADVVLSEARAPSTPPKEAAPLPKGAPSPRDEEPAPPTAAAEPTQDTALGPAGPAAPSDVAVQPRNTSATVPTSNLSGVLLIAAGVLGLSAVALGLVYARRRRAA